MLHRSRNVYEKGIAAEDAIDVDALPEPPAIADISWKAWQLTQARIALLRLVVKRRPTSAICPWQCAGQQKASPAYWKSR